jgi:hypothetical protein
VAKITDDEICSLIVALSRTRKCCHVISFRWFGSGGALGQVLSLAKARPAFALPRPGETDRAFTGVSLGLAS